MTVKELIIKLMELNALDKKVNLAIDDKDNFYQGYKDMDVYINVLDEITIRVTRQGIRE